MKTEIYKCDGAACGKIKGEANHWFSLAITSNEPGGAVFMSFYPRMEQSGKHFCGQECLFKAILTALGK